MSPGVSSFLFRSPELRSTCRFAKRGPRNRPRGSGTSRSPKTLFFFLSLYRQEAQKKDEDLIFLALQTQMEAHTHQAVSRCLCTSAALARACRVWRFVLVFYVQILFHKGNGIPQAAHFRELLHFFKQLVTWPSRSNIVPCDTPCKGSQEKLETGPCPSTCMMGNENFEAPLPTSFLRSGILIPPHWFWIPMFLLSCLSVTYPVCSAFSSLPPGTCLFSSSSSIRHLLTSSPSASAAN